MASPGRASSHDLAVAHEASVPVASPGSAEQAVYPGVSANPTSASPSPDGAASVDSPATFAEVFARFGDYVPALLRRLGVAPSEIPDVAQEVFTVVHQKLPTFRGDSSLKTWLCGISLRLASNYRRRAWVRRLVVFGEVEQHAVAADGFDRLELQERVLRLEAALEQLPAKQREVFVLFEIEELSMAEIALALRCPEKTAYTRLYAARRAMTKKLAARSAAARNP
jgi:RNA polymerase sigma-70 factor (ECF subfamily)